MPRKPQPWFRFYTETMSDRKIKRFAPAERWVWAGIMAAARESPEPGRLLIAEGEPMNADDLAGYADVPKKTALSALDKARRFGMVHDEQDVMVVTNFGKRQYESDVSTSRTRTHRERSKEQGRNVPTSSDGTDVGTGPSRARPTETETEPKPTVSPRADLALIADHPTAQTIVGEWLDHCTKRPPNNVIGQTSKTIRELLAEGIDPDGVRRGVAAWMHKGLHPAALASVVNEVMNAQPRRPRQQQDTDDMFDRAARRLGVIQ